MKKLLCLLALLSLGGCFTDRQSLETYQQTARVDNSLVQRYQEPQSRTEEYVNRIAKRVSVVSDRSSNDVNIYVVSSSEPSIELDHENHAITISRGALVQLRDEAELAAALTFGMARLDNVQNSDQETAVTLAKAGYDPQAMLDLQRQYLYANQNHWLNPLFPTPPTTNSIAANKAMVDKMSQGLIRDADNYNKNINENG